MSRFLPDWLPSGKTLAVVPPFAWLLVFLLVPFLLVFKISFAELQFGVPPYTPGRIQGRGGAVQPAPARPSCS